MTIIFEGITAQEALENGSFEFETRWVKDLEEFDVTACVHSEYSFTIYDMKTGEEIQTTDSDILVVSIDEIPT